MKALAVVWLFMTLACSGDRVDLRPSVRHEVTLLAGSDEIRLEVSVPRGYQPDRVHVRGKYLGPMRFNRGHERIAIAVDMHALPLDMPPDLLAKIRDGRGGQELRRPCYGRAWDPDEKIAEFALAHARGQDGSESAICMNFQRVRRRFWRPESYTVRTVIPVGRDWLLECSIGVPGEQDEAYEDATHWSRSDLDDMMRICASMRVIEFRPTPAEWYRG